MYGHGRHPGEAAKEKVKGKFQNSTHENSILNIFVIYYSMQSICKKAKHIFQMSILRLEYLNLL